MESEIVYRLAVPEDHDAILEFMRGHFFPDEPLTNSNEPKAQGSYIEEFIMSYLTKKDNANIVAICDGKIVGARLAAPKESDEQQKLLEEAARISGQKWEYPMMLLAHIEKGANVFEKYQVDKIMHGIAVAVHKDYRGRRIGIKLYENATKRAKELGYKVFTNDCTSIYSQRMCRDFGMDCTYEYAFADFRVPNCDSQVLFPPAEHKVMKSYAKRL